MEFAGTGSVVSWNEERGFGFVRDDRVKGKDLFAHAKDTSDIAVRRAGARVSYEVRPTDKGFQAVRIRVCGEVQEPAAEVECDVLSEEEFLAELREIDWFAVVPGLVAMARKHGWVE